MPTEEEVNGAIDNWYFLGTASVDAQIGYASRRPMRRRTASTSATSRCTGTTTAPTRTRSRNYLHLLEGDPPHLRQLPAGSVDVHREGGSGLRVQPLQRQAPVDCRLRWRASSTWFHAKNENAGEAFEHRVARHRQVLLARSHARLDARLRSFRARADAFPRRAVTADAPLFENTVLHSESNTPTIGARPAFRLAPPRPQRRERVLRDVGFGGRPLENALLDGKREFSVAYVANAGSYYDRIHSAILFSLSEDRYIAETRQAFFDARSRAISLADLFPDGFRRVIANALTGDRSILAPRVEATPAARRFSIPRPPPTRRGCTPSIRWAGRASGLRKGRKSRFASQGRNVCSDFAGVGTGRDPLVAANTLSVNPQIGWEVQKFLIAWTMAFVTANQRSEWVDMIDLYGSVGTRTLLSASSWQDPTSGETYYARSYGKECLFGDAADGCAGGKLVEKGIAARVLEYANVPTSRGYKLDEATFPATDKTQSGFNAYGRAMVLHHPDGHAIVKVDPAVGVATPDWGIKPSVDCDQNMTPGCTQLTADQNHWAWQLLAYKSVPDFLGQTALAYGIVPDSGFPR